MSNYKSAGVDIEAGNNFVDYIKNKVGSTFTSNVLGGLGGYGSLFALKDLNYQDAVLVSGTDGVGTKLKIAEAINKYDTIGIDLVAMCVNDILCHGARPLFFLDYIACAAIDPSKMQSLLDGIIEGCKISKMSLIGGETAEMPSVYSAGNFDLAGFSVGIVERADILPKIQEIKGGEIIIGIHSSGPHSNGFSLIRKIIEDNQINYHDKTPFNDMSWGEFLLTPTIIYTEICSLLMPHIKALAHITGGGITENLPRVLPANINAIIDKNSWIPHIIFSWLADKGNINEDEMFRVFNMGIGMIAICDSSNLTQITNILNEHQYKFDIIGTLEENIDGGIAEVIYSE